MPYKDPEVRKSKQKGYAAKHYKHNTEEVKAKMTEKRSSLRKTWKAFKATLFCTKCGFNHPAELERLTGVDDTTCKKIVHEIYMERFNDRDCWEPERVGDIWVIFGKNFSGEWINEDGDYMGFDTKREANDYIKETFK
jgi:hypothetical protein